jgi:stage IV sporulation protein FB
MLSFNIKGFGINLKPSFFIMCLVLIAAGRLTELCILVFSVTMHELAHISAAFLCGLTPEGIVITPIGEQAVIRGMERVSFFRRILIVISGPCVNLLFWLLFDSYINLGILILNILPVYPLDGGRLLHYVLGYCIGVLRANRIQSFLSRGIAALIFAIGFIQPVLCGFNISLLCVGMYLLRINRREYINMTLAFYRSVMYRSDKKVLSVRGVVAGEGICLKTIVYRLGWDYYTVVYVRGHDGSCSVGIGEERLIDYILRKNINDCLSEVLYENADS